MMTNKRFQGAVAALLGALVVGVGCYFWGLDNGKQKGLDSYHDLCYTVGGWAIDNKGRVVECRPLTTIPKEELKLEPRITTNQSITK
jgi:hypothetical protein